MSNPLNDQALEELESICRCSVQAFISTTTEILRAIDKYYNEDAVFPKLPHDIS